MWLYAAVIFIASEVLVIHVRGWSVIHNSYCGNNTKKAKAHNSREKKNCYVQWEFKGPFFRDAELFQLDQVCSFQRETSLTPVHFISPISRQSIVMPTQTSNMS